MTPVPVTIGGPADRPALFCRLPFTEVSIDEFGEVWPNCCPDWVDVSLGNLTRQGWDEVWNGPAAQALRRSAHDGTLRHCDRGWCPHIQAALAGEADHRVRPLGEQEALDLPEAALRGEVVVETGPENVGMHYEQSCNLACPTCRDAVYVVGGPEAEALRAVHDVVEAEVLRYPRAISLTGAGDPFASRVLRDFLIGFDRARFPSIETIHLHTNAVLWTPRLWARMRGLHEVEVTTDVSIDAARPETYRRVRPPADWDQLLDNLAFIGTIPNVASIGISMVVSQANLDELCEFHDLGRRLHATSARFTFVEYKQVRRRWHHDDATWARMGLEHLDGPQQLVLGAQLRRLRERRRAGLVPEIRSNLDEVAAALG